MEHVAATCSRVKMWCPLIVMCPQWHFDKGWSQSSKGGGPQLASPLHLLMLKGAHWPAELSGLGPTESTSFYFRLLSLWYPRWKMSTWETADAWEEF